MNKFYLPGRSLSLLGDIVAVTVAEVAPKGFSDCRVGIGATVNDGFCHQLDESQALPRSQDNSSPIMMTYRLLPHARGAFQATFGNL